MKKNLLFTLLLGISFSPLMNAATLSPEEALARYNSSRPRKMVSGLKKESKLKLQSTVGNLYVFSAEKGFVLLPADDEAPVLLGYSDSDEFDLQGNPALQEWLGFYNKELEYLKNHPEKGGVAKIVHKNREAIAPLLKTEWNQEYPYNLLCPKVDGKETVTGCVATAMAQVMKFHNFPEHGKGSHSYYWKPGEQELTFDYDTTPFNWNLMDDVYDKDSSEESRQAVAELMLGCGISVDMNYRPGDSGASTFVMGASLIDIFGYSRSLWMPNRAFYGYDEWEDMIYADLSQGLPVLYSGAGTAGGHQFICDGYSSDGFFHFNWGWGGLSNGYFLLTALNPDDLGVGGGAGGFNSSQVATLGVRPPKGEEKPVYIFYDTESFTTDMKEVSSGNDFRCTGLYYNFSLSVMPEGSNLGMKFVSEGNGEIKYVEGPGVDGLKPQYGRKDIQIRFPELADGKYQITPALHVDGEWSDVRIPVGNANMVIATVNDGVATFESAEPASIRVVDIQLPSQIFVDHDFPMSFVVENTGDDEFYSTVTPVLLDNDGQEVSKSVFRPVDVLVGEKLSVTDYIGKFTALKDMTLTEGDYTLFFRDEAGKTVSDSMSISLKVNDETPVISISDFKIASADPIVDPSAVEVTMNVDCQDGVYYGSAMFVVFPGDGGYELFHKSSTAVYLIPGEKKELSMTADMSKLKDGSYMAAIYMEGKQMTDPVHFNIKRDGNGIENIDQDIIEPVIFNLNGVRIKSPSSPGIYIINGKKILLKE